MPSPFAPPQAALAYHQRAKKNMLRALQYAPTGEALDALVANLKAHDASIRTLTRINGAALQARLIAGADRKKARANG